MKKFNWLLAGTVCLFLAAMLLIWQVHESDTEKRDREYLVQINRVMAALEAQGFFSPPDLQGKDTLLAVSFLEAGQLADETEASAFFQNRNGCERIEMPLIVDGQVLGLVKFDYARADNPDTDFWLAEAILFLTGCLMVGILVYVRSRMLSPLWKLRELPYELAKGHLGMEIDESRDRFLGKFLWGLSMLQDHLRVGQMKNLALEREKKLLLLSLSHDIKTPLNSIKLYARALQEGVYDTEEKRLEAVEQMERHSNDIESYINEIVHSAGEDILSIEVQDSEFYLSELITKVKSYYESRCRLSMTNFSVMEYENRLLKGDLDRTFEVMENIIENALKYGDGKKLVLSFYEEDYSQIIQIENSGTPVLPEEMPHLFDSFFRGSNVGKCQGNGLGLYICREIMRKMGGEIFAERGAEGMRFHLVLRL